MPRPINQIIQHLNYEQKRLDIARIKLEESMRAVSEAQKEVQFWTSHIQAYRCTIRSLQNEMAEDQSTRSIRKCRYCGSPIQPESCCGVCETTLPLGRY